MRNFPVPYSNELIYSTIARAGVYQGIVSPKQLLDEVYGNRKVIATLDLPSHLGVIARHLHQTGRYAVQQLIYEHTLFPLYAPFVGKERRDEAIEQGKDAIARALREHVWPLLATGVVRPVIHSTFAAADASQAHVLMESNQHIGKIVLTW